MFTTRLNWAASFHCAVIHSADIPGKKKSIGILQSIASFSWLLLPHPTHAVIWREREREIEREFVVNRCWSKPKCHTDTDLAAPSGQEVLSWPGVAFISYP